VSALHVLFVCEANRSRSPVAEALWARESARLGIDGVASSAGIRAHTGDRVSHPVAWAAAHQGLDLTPHRSRLLDEDTVAAADLILPMTRAQADHIGMHHRRVADRMFLVSELAELLHMGEDDDESALPDDAQLPPLNGHRDPAERLADVIRVAQARRLMRGIQDDDVTEPGEDPEAIAGVIIRLTADVTAIAEHLVLN